MRNLRNWMGNCDLGGYVICPDGAKSPPTPCAVRCTRLQHERRGVATTDSSATLEQGRQCRFRMGTGLLGSSGSLEPMRVQYVVRASSASEQIRGRRQTSLKAKCLTGRTLEEGCATALLT